MVYVRARQPAVAQVRTGNDAEPVAAFLDSFATVGQPAPVVDAVKREVEVRPRARFAPKIDLVREAALAEILRPVHGIVAAINRPIIAETVDVSAPVRAAKARC